ncbi:MAG: hypothetical protein MHM6MM_000715 [Cercozoa sp. M6MM]
MSTLKFVLKSIEGQIADGRIEARRLRNSITFFERTTTPPPSIEELGDLAKRLQIPARTTALLGVLAHELLWVPFLRRRETPSVLARVLSEVLDAWSPHRIEWDQFIGQNNIDPCVKHVYLHPSLSLGQIKLPSFTTTRALICSCDGDSELSRLVSVLTQHCQHSPTSERLEACTVLNAILSTLCDERVGPRLLPHLPLLYEALQRHVTWSSLPAMINSAKFRASCDIEQPQFSYGHRLVLLLMEGSLGTLTSDAMQPVKQLLRTKFATFLDSLLSEIFDCPEDVSNTLSSFVAIDIGHFLLLTAEELGTFVSLLARVEAVDQPNPIYCP